MAGPALGGVRGPGNTPSSQHIPGQQVAWIHCVDGTSPPCAWDRQGKLVRRAESAETPEAAPGQLSWVHYGGAPGDARHELIRMSELERRCRFVFSSVIAAATRKVQLNLPLFMMAPDDLGDDLLVECAPMDAERCALVRSAFSHPSLYVAPDDYGGHGLFAGGTIERGAYLCEYTGILFPMTAALLAAAHDDYSMRYVGAYPEASLYLSARDQGSLARFANHAHGDQASCLIRLVLVDGAYHTVLVTARDVHPREELTFDYGESYWMARGREPGGPRS